METILLNANILFLNLAGEEGGGGGEKKKKLKYT
jgi:hypothetical protein